MTDHPPVAAVEQPSGAPPPPPENDSAPRLEPEGESSDSKITCLVDGHSNPTADPNTTPVIPAATPDDIAGLATAPPLTLTVDHRGLLHAAAITDSAIEAVGIRSITDIADMPPELAWVRATPGILFPLPRLDGTVVPQYRPDAPVGGGPKYVQPADSGSAITVHPAMRDRIGKANRIVIVEGTKQTLAAVSHAPDDVLVVGLQGCTGWLTDGLPHRDLAGLGVGSDTEVTIIFDADTATNRTVWDAAHDLGEHFLTLGAGKVAYSRLSTRGTNGLDDYLGSLPAELRDGAFAALLKNAKRLPRRPAARKRPATRADSAPIVDWAACTIREPDMQIGEDILPGKPLAAFAARIRLSRIVIDDLNADVPQQVTHDLEVRIDDAEHIVRGVVDSKLRDVRAWLEQLPGGAGTGVWWETSPSGCSRIESAVRGHGATDTAAAYRRTGLLALPDRIGFLHPQGLLCSDGNHTDVSAQLEPVLQPFQLTDPDAAATSSGVNAINEVGFKWLVDATAWWVLLGGICWASSGARPRTTIWILGLGGSGKSVIIETATSLYSPRWHFGSEESQGTADGTANSVGERGHGLHHAVAFIDDVRRKSRREEEAQTAGVEMLVRRSYGGGSAGKRRMVWSGETGRTSHVAPDAASPLVAVAGEILPNAQDAPTTVQRLLLIPVTPATTMRPGGTARMTNLGADGTLNNGLSAFIRWMLARIEELDPDPRKALGMWLQAQLLRRQQFEQELLTEPLLAGSPVRQREILAPVLLGLEMWQTFCGEVGVIISDAAMEKIRAGLIAVSSENAAAHVADSAPVDTTLARLRSHVASGQAIITGVNESTVVARPVIGAVTEIGGIAHVAILGSEVAAVVGAVNGAEVASRLQPALLKSVDGKLTRPVKIGGQTVRAICVPLTVWNDDGDDVASVQTIHQTTVNF